MARRRNTTRAADPVVTASDPDPAPAPADPAHPRAIRVLGARVHNLQNLEVEIPHDRLVVLTGVSGSGKSSLAFHTIHAEGLRRYIETLSTSARQFWDQLERPDVDRIDGLPPTIALEQTATVGGPRSTVGTVTEILDHLRLLYARAGLPHCPRCGGAIRSLSPEEIVSHILRLDEGRKVIVMAPMVRGRRSRHLEAYDAIRREGLLRMRVDGTYFEIQDAPELARDRPHTIEAVVDRLVVREGIRPRLAESVDRSLKLGEGAVLLSIQEDDGAWSERLLSATLACPKCSIGLPPLEPRLFSFNSPHGACPVCDGLGTVSRFDPESLIVDRSRSLDRGAVPTLDHLGAKARREVLASPDVAGLLTRFGIGPETPLTSWPGEAVETLIGNVDEPGPLPAALDRVWNALPESRKKSLETDREQVICPGCRGARLRPEARAVTVGGKALHELAALPIPEVNRFLASLDFEPPLVPVGSPIVSAMIPRLAYLDQVGLGYLSLDRPSRTLSGGEFQRVRLAAQIGSGLVGAAFLLDEPTSGLHQSDTARLLEAVKSLRDAGNTVVVVEHDEETIRAADWVIDLGPGAGPDGGRIVAQGPPDRLDGPESLTARYLNRPRPAITGDAASPLDAKSGWIEVVGASERNLKGDPVRFPIGCLTSVTGVSGSGKSTLVLDVLAPATRRHLQLGGPRPGRHDRVDGLDAIQKLIVVDQSPLGRTPRSTPATATGVFDGLRRLFARTREARLRGFKASRFSYNLAGGRCEACQGLGQRRIRMTFLPDLHVACETCGGRRYNRPTLDIRFKGASIADVLAMRIEDARAFLADFPEVRRGLDALHDAGLGYLALGQSAGTLSGGESQRVKLAAALSRPTLERSLFLLDEPTTGLHAADVENLLRVLRRLVDRGETVVVIEHNLDLIRASDWIIDLGPEGGDRGGHVVVMGMPAEVAARAVGATSRALVGGSRGGTTRGRRQRMV